MSQDQYENSLEKVLTVVEKDYWTQYVDINRHQVIVGKTYLWVSVALAGAYIASLRELSIPLLDFPLCAMPFLFICFLTVIAAFGTCLFAIPARQGYRTLHVNGWGELSAEAHRLYTQNKEKSYPIFLGSLISRFDHATKHNTETNIERGKLLRLTSWLLLASFISAFLAGSILATYEAQLTSSKETIMSEEENSSNNAPANQSSESDIPPPPPPAGAAHGSNITTHSRDDSKVSGRVSTFDHAPKTKGD